MFSNRVLTNLRKICFGCETPYSKKSLDGERCVDCGIPIISGTNEEFQKELVKLPFYKVHSLIQKSSEIKQISTFVVEIYEIHIQKVLVHAKTRKEAIQKIHEGEFDVTEDTEYLENAEMHGKNLPAPIRSIEKE